ncbi:MAG: heme a synthase [Acidobacteriota bacterium]|nr:heme a synthase [Acidobacteriota bacterium]
MHGNSSRVSLSAAAYRRVTFFALVALGVIVVSGAAVRLSGSGLGCPDWPNCDTGHLTPHGTTGYHGAIEFVNRAFTGLVSILVMLAVLGSLVRSPRRRDLTWLSAGLVAGVLAQIVLGGLVVLYGLSPPWVMAHFVVSMLLVADAVVLHHRAGEPEGRRVPVVDGRIRVLGAVLVAMASVVIAAGTVVTGAGPHGGDEEVRRLDFSVTDVARIHGILVCVFIVTLLVTLWLLGKTGAPTDVRRAAGVLLAVVVAQAFIGYVQYFSGVPEVLVAVHIVGAVSVWVATLQFVLGLRAPDQRTTRERDLVELAR